MIKVDVTKQSNYPISAVKIKKKLADFFAKSGIVSDAEVSVAIVGEKKMLAIGKKYLKDGKLHNVLSFTPGEEKFVYGKAARFAYPPDNTLHLGEIVVCYPLVVEEAKRENSLIEDRVLNLIEHSAMHLLGIHHEH